jgi:hypothetical protein
MSQQSTRGVGVGVGSVSFDKLEKIKMKIESMTKHHQIEVLKIFNQFHTKLNENKSGVFINLSFLSPDIIEVLEKFIQYVEEQEDSLVIAEYQKEEYKNTMFISSNNNNI